MRKHLKAFAGAGVTLLLGLGVEMVDLQTPGLGWFFFGVATFWAFVALFKNKALLRKFPAWTGWVPFLEEDLITPPKELTGTYIQGQTFQLATITHRNKVEDRVFERCSVLGPGMVYMKHCTISDCFLDPNAFFPIVNDGTFMGIIGVYRCTFQHFRFDGIGFVDSEAGIRQIQESCDSVDTGRAQATRGIASKLRHCAFLRPSGAACFSSTNSTGSVPMFIGTPPVASVVPRN